MTAAAGPSPPIATIRAMSRPGREQGHRLLEDSQQNIWVGLHASPPNSFSGRETSLRADRHADCRSQGGRRNPGEHGLHGLPRRAVGRRRRRAGPYRPTHRREPHGGAAGEGPVEVLTIGEHPAGTLWVGTLGRGLFRLDGTAATSRPTARGGRSRVPRQRHRHPRLRRQGRRAWLATWNGLARFEPATGRFETFKRNPQSAAEGYFSIVEDPTGDLWLGAPRGSSAFRQETAGSTATRASRDALALSATIR